MDEASEAYNDASGFWRKIRIGLRRFGKTNKAFGAWAGLLPSQSEYFSIICGGFKLILGVGTLMPAGMFYADLNPSGCGAFARSSR